MTENQKEIAKSLGNIGQSMRPPLNALSSAFSLLCSHLPEGDSRDEEYIGVITRAYHRLLRFTDALSVYGEIVSGDLALDASNVSIDDLFMDTFARLDYFASTMGIHLKYEGGARGLIMSLDTAKINRALLHIVSNAIKHTPAGGTITLSLKRLPSGVIISVRDNGPGISSEALARLFSAVELPDPSKLTSDGELGLGLFIVRSIAELHGGRVMLTNRPEGGVEVAMELPVKPADDAALLRNAHTGYDSSGGFSPELIELSPLLPSKCYMRNNI